MKTNSVSKAHKAQGEATTAKSAGLAPSASRPAKKTATPAGGQPRLLAGGNPQIAKGQGDGAVQAYIAAMPGWKREVGQRLDSLIAATVPNVQKSVRWNTPFYGVAGQGWFLGFHCLTKSIKVAFFRGSALSPLPPGESKSQGTRYVDIAEGEPLDEQLVASWVQQAAALPGWLSK